VRQNDGAMFTAVESAGWFRSLVIVVALTMALLVWVKGAEARLDAEPNFDSASAWLFTPTPIADAAPIVVAALDRPGAAQPAHPGGSLDGLFNRPGLLAGFAAGFLGAGLLGLLFGQGIFGGLGGVASALGLIFQLALVLMLVRLIWTWWSGRNAPAFAGLSPRQQAEAYLRSRNELLPGIYPPAAADDATKDGETTAPNARSADPSARGERKE
jgi:predicted lipid-binding transport protein (Tim44 family)